MRGEIEAWLREGSAELGLENVAGQPTTAFHFALLPGGGERWRGVCLVWRGDSPKPCVVIKFARDPADNPRISNEPAALGALAGFGVAGRVPRHLRGGTVAQRAIAAETVVPGRPLSVLLGRHRRPAKLLSALSEFPPWMTKIAAASSRPSHRDEAESWITEPLRRASRDPALTEIERSVLDDLLEEAGRLSDRAPLPAVYTHNDPGPPNVLVDHRCRFTGLVDWEGGGWGLPISDLMYFLARLGEDLGDIDLTPAIVAGPPQALELDYVSVARSSLHEMCEELGVEVRWLPVIAALAWLHHAGREAARDPAGQRERLARRRLHRYLDGLAQRDL